MSAPLRIAIAEDEPLNLGRLARMLREQDCQVVAELEDGLAVLEWLEAGGDADALFLDIRMPELSGLEVARRLQGEHLPLVFVTAYPVHAVDAYQVGVVDYLLKPVEEQRLALALERVAALRRRSIAPRATGPFRYLVRAGDGYVFMNLSQTSHFEYEDGVVWAFAQGRFRTAWKTLAEAEAALAGQGLIKAHRHVLVRFEAIVGMKPLDSGRLMIRLPGGTEIKVSRSGAHLVKTRLGVE
nr:response regulator transcription factor [uncultured Holophaga sp.]